MRKVYATKYEKYNPFNKFDFAQESILLINGAEVYREFSGSFASSLRDLKRNYRRRLKYGKELHRLAVTDGTNFYQVLFESESIGKEFEVMKRLKAQIEREHTYSIVMFDGEREKEYLPQLKIVRV